MKLKKLFFISLITAVISISYSGFVLAKNFEVNNEKVKQYKYDYRHAIFERDGQVYIYHEDSNSIEPVGDPSKAKSMPSLSPDHQKVAFTYLQANISHF